MPLDASIWAMMELTAAMRVEKVENGNEEQACKDNTFNRGFK